MIFCGIVAFLLLLVMVSVYGLFCGIFCYPVRRRHDVHCIPDSYQEFRDEMLELVNSMERTPYEEVLIRSLDDLQLYGKLYYIRPGAPLMIFLHGYHGTDAWDGYGFFKLCKENGINILVADERSHGKSEGNVTTFGIYERYDCKLWAEYAAKRFGKNIDIFLAGVSMGAATVMMSTELGLPENVKGIIEDCGYTEPVTVIQETIRAWGLPVKPIYFLIQLGVRLFGHFDLKAATALHAVENLDIPILFIHGDQDSLVPFSMGQELYQACVAQKEWLAVKGADHANSAMVDYAAYENAVLQFISAKQFSIKGIECL